MSRDHILHVARINIAAVVGARYVVGVKPAISQRRCGLFRALPVFGHNVRRTHADLAGVTDGDLLIGLVENLYLAAFDGKSARKGEFRCVSTVV
jgi:hypothetical protein